MTNKNCSFCLTCSRVKTLIWTQKNTTFPYSIMISCDVNFDARSIMNLSTHVKLSICCWELKQWPFIVAKWGVFNAMRTVAESLKKRWYSKLSHPVQRWSKRQLEYTIPLGGCICFIGDRGQHEDIFILGNNGVHRVVCLTRYNVTMLIYSNNWVPSPLNSSTCKVYLSNPFIYIDRCSFDFFFAALFGSFNL